MRMTSIGRMLGWAVLLLISSLHICFCEGLESPCAVQLRQSGRTCSGSPHKVQREDAPRGPSDDQVSN